MDENKGHKKAKLLEIWMMNHTESTSHTQFCMVIYS